MNKIRELREDNDYTQIEIAKILETSQTVYSRYERGERELPIKYLKTLCLLYGVQSDYILGLPKGLKYPERWGIKNEKWI